jgi:hypothetical protein
VSGGPEFGAVLQGCNSIPLLDRALRDLSVRSNGVSRAWEVWGIKAEKVQLISSAPPTPVTNTMPTAAEIRRQIADMALALAEAEKAEEEKKAADAEAAKEAAEVKKKADEAEAKRKADEAAAEKAQKAKKTSSKEADAERKAKVRALAATKRKDKEVEKTPEAEVEVETETRQDCDSCARKELICEWRVVSNSRFFQPSGVDFQIGRPLEGLPGLSTGPEQMLRRWRADGPQEASSRGQARVTQPQKSPHYRTGDQEGFNPYG